MGRKCNNGIIISANRKLFGVTSNTVTNYTILQQLLRTSQAHVKESTCIVLILVAVFHHTKL